MAIRKKSRTRPAPPTRKGRAKPKAARTPMAARTPKTSPKPNAARRRKETVSDQAASPRLPRVAKGKKPQYFSDPAIDKLLWMTLTLMEELSVARDRLDTVERLLAKKRLLSAKEIESWQPDDQASAERSARRAAYVDRMMRAIHSELEELTRGDMPASEAEVIAAVES